MTRLNVWREVTSPDGRRGSAAGLPSLDRLMWTAIGVATITLGDVAPIDRCNDRRSLPTVQSA
jgi:hypothetical protein